MPEHRYFHLLVPITPGEEPDEGEGVRYGKVAKRTIMPWRHLPPRLTRSPSPANTITSATCTDEIFGTHRRSQAQRRFSIQPSDADDQDQMQVLGNDEVQKAPAAEQIERS
ncbi:hypothetical protein Aph01nite_19640 [Acrocarpospora phusangensis]|uniref:Uncharacterized protein n=1 Tax=Acrocarpospora phusangensis TaxID=1070424 RepID=A0A919Q747_9ACTN|nr:hypothetical protein Aph01nite_19640 [Acrocarpospora phusangensis]